MKNILINLFIALTYILIGKLSLLLSSLDGYSTPIWPPAGLSLGLAIIYGNKIWFGLFLGAYFTNTNDLNISIEFLNGLFNNLQNLTIAFGNSLGAIIGSYIVNKKLKNNFHFYTIKDIFSFFIFAGSISPLIAATIGVTSLYLSKVIYFEFILNTWITWWLGDAIGIIIFTPLIIVFWKWRKNLEVKSRVLIVTITTLCTFVIALLIFFFTRHWEKNFIEYRIKSDGIIISESISTHLKNTFTTVKSLRNYMKVAENLNRKKFELFAEESLKQSKGILAFSWNPFISNSERNNYENQLRIDYPESMGIKERNLENNFEYAIQKDKYVFVRYIFPYDENKDAIGYNVWSNEIRKKALLNAKKTNEIEITSKIKLVQKSEHVIGILVFNYSSNIFGEEGFSTAVLQLSSIIEESLIDFKNLNLCINIYDDLNPEDPLLFKVNCEDVNNTIFKKFTIENKIFLGSRTWTVSVQPTKNYFIANLSKSSYFILIISSILMRLCHLKGLLKFHQGVLGKY